MTDLERTEQGADGDRNEVSVDEAEFDGPEDGAAGRQRRPRPLWRLLRVRLAWAIPTLLIVSFGIFVLIDLAPGDAAARIAGDNATPEEIAHLRQSLGLNDPLLVRYGRWLGNAVHGDLGTSLSTGEPVTTVIARSLPLTLSIMVVTLVLTIIVAGILGVLAAVHPGGIIDRLISLGMAVAIAVPSFVLCLVLVSELAVKRDFLPAIGYVGLTENPVEWLRHLIIPAMTLAAVMVGEMARQLRTSLVDVLDRDYILAAYAKGLPKRVVVMKHGLKNAAMPVLTVIGTRFALLIGGTVLVEEIVVIRGVGYSLINAVLNRDVTVVTGIAVVTTLLVLLVNLVVDLLYGVVNPKLRVS
jgi:peptide/nickel transport system permease protein